MSTDTTVPQAGLAGPDAQSRLELRIQTMLSPYGPPLDYHPIEIADDNFGWLEDLLEFLPKQGFVGLELVGMARDHAQVRSEWQESAHDAGCVDTLTFPSTDNQLPKGHNLTVTAGHRLIEKCNLETRGLSILLLGSGVDARSMVGVVAQLGARHIHLYDPDAEHARLVAENAVGSGIDRSLIDLVGGFNEADAFDAVIDLLPETQSALVWQELGEGFRSLNLSWAIRPTESRSASPRVKAEVDVHSSRLCVERTACARELFTGVSLPELATDEVYSLLAIEDSNIPVD